MVITTSPRFESEIQDIFDFIAQDSKESKERAKKFRKEISAKINNLLVFPHIGRKKDNNRRELIYKGYIVPYFINNDEILLLGIYKENLWEF